jgi:hypothetical protein
MINSQTRLPGFKHTATPVGAAFVVACTWRTPADITPRPIAGGVG